jgi:hypothetical protein
MAQASVASVVSKRILGKARCMSLSPVSVAFGRVVQDLDVWVRSDRAQTVLRSRDLRKARHEGRPNPASLARASFRIPHSQRRARAPAPI